MTIPEWMDEVCVLMIRSWQELAQGRIHHRQRNPKEARTPWNWELPFSSHPSQLWMDPLPFSPFLALLGEPGVGISPPDLGKLHYPCIIPLFPDHGTKAWMDTLKSKFEGLIPWRKRNSSFLPLFQAGFCSISASPKPLPSGMGSDFPTELHRASREDGKHLEKGNSCQTGHKNSRGFSEALGSKLLFDGALETHPLQRFMG